jgi:hypothetical protein
MKTKKNSCVIFSQPGWETAPLVHYGYEMHAAGNWPKWEHIERLRPF